MIVTVLGGSACSTPVLADWLASNHSARPITLRLAGRTQQKLRAVARACRLLAGDSALQIEQFGSGEWASALSRADVVLIQVRVGDLPARQFDEAFPPNYGIPGDEGLGPGGLSAAVRTWPELRHILSLIALHAPSCLPLLLTSPAGLLLRCAAREFPQLPLYAIFELPFTTLAQVCAVANVPLDQVSFSYAGVNHLGWLYDVTCNGADLICKYADQADSSFRALIRSHHAVPLKYWRLHFEKASVAAAQRRESVADSRSSHLMRLQAKMLRAFAQGNTRAIREALYARPAEWYTEALGPLLAELAGSGDVQPYFISQAEPTTPVYEQACRLDGQKFVPLPVTKPPASVRRLVERFAEYEDVAEMSVLEPDRAGLERALLAHPWLDNSALAASLASEIWNRSEAEAPHVERNVACTA